MPIVIGPDAAAWNDPLNLFGDKPDGAAPADSAEAPRFSAQDRDDVINTVIGEAVGEGEDGMAAVVNVIRNRADRRGLSLGDVVRQPKQFTGYEAPGPEALKAMRDPALRERVGSLIDRALSGELPDATGGADHYHADSVSPGWAAKMPRTATLGRHLFYDSGASPAPRAAAYAPGLKVDSEEPFQAVLRGEAPASPPRAADDSLLLSKLQPGKPSTYISDMSDGMRNGLTHMFSEAPDFVRDGLDILSGARTPEKQAQIIADHAGKYGFDRRAWMADVERLGPVEAGRKWRPQFRELGLTKNIGMPGGSKHQHGEATDLGWKGRAFATAPKEVHEWVHANAGKYGLHFPMAHEPWHVEVAGSRDGSGGTAKTTGKTIVVGSDFVPSDPMGLMARENPFAQHAGQQRADEARGETERADAHEQVRIAALNERHNAEIERLVAENPGKYELVPGDEAESWQQQWEADNRSSGLMGDIYRIGKSGVASVLQSLTAGADTIFPHIPGGQKFIDASDAIDRWMLGDELDDVADRFRTRANASVSDRQEVGDLKNWWNEEKGWFGPAWGDPRSYLRLGVESLPGTLHHGPRRCSGAWCLRSHPLHLPDHNERLRRLPRKRPSFPVRCWKEGWAAGNLRKPFATGSDRCRASCFLLLMPSGRSSIRG